MVGLCAPTAGYMFLSSECVYVCHICHVFSAAAADALSLACTKQGSQMCISATTLEEPRSPSPPPGFETGLLAPTDPPPPSAIPP